MGPVVRLGMVGEPDPDRSEQAAEKVLKFFEICRDALAFRLSRRAISRHSVRLFPLPLGSADFHRLALPVFHAESNFSNRTKFAAAAYNRNCQSTRRPRNFVFRRPAELFIHPNIFSTTFPFPFLMANPASSPPPRNRPFFLTRP